MKTKLKLSFTVVLLALAAFAFCFGAFNSGVNKASAEDWTYGTKEEETGTFAMVDSVKLRTDGDGFQFKAKMDKGTSESLSSNQKVYFIIIPETYKKTLEGYGAYRAIARFTDPTKDNYGEYDIEHSLCLYVRAVRSTLADDGCYYYYGGVSNLAKVSQQKFNYYAVAVIETRNDAREENGKLTYDYTYATYETAAPETNIYSTITSAILNVKEDYMAEISENYSWYGKEDYPLNVTSLEDYNKLVGKLNANLDLADIIIEFDADYASQDGAATITSEENRLYTVSFMNGDSVYKTYKVKNGAKITAPAVNPTKAADNVYTYLFNSWQVSGENFDFANETITTETVLNANYTLLTKEERSSKYVTGDKIGGDSGMKIGPVSMASLDGKALHLEFKFTSDTGRFGFAICCDDYQWSNITGTLVIEKQAGGAIVANMGKIKALEDGWYAWELNRDMFSGNGASIAEDVSLIYHQGETVQGNVMIDWNSMQAVDAYTLTKEERSSRYVTGDKIGGDSGMKIGPVSMASLDGKALHLEFKFVSATGAFGFVLLDGDGEWPNITDTVTVTKNANDIIVNRGKIVPLDEGWYAWELNRAVFAGSNVQNAQNVSLVYHQNQTVTGEVLIDWKSLAAVEPQTYFSSNNKIAWSFSSGNGITSQIASESGSHNALKITNDNTHSHAQWQYFVLQLDPATIAKLDNAKELALKLKVQRNTAASNVTFNFRISSAKLINDQWVPDDKNWAKNATDSGVADGYSNNVALDTWHTIRFLRKTCWGSDTIAALKANGGKILIFIELQNNNTGADFDSGTDFGFNLIIDDMTVTEYKYILDFENASDADLLQTRSYNSDRVSTCELSTEQKVSGEKSVKVYQNQYGALVVKIPDAMKAAMDGNAKLSVRFKLTQVTKDGALVPEPNPVPTVAFYACSTPNPDTDTVEKDDAWKDCRIGGNDWQANVSQNTWYTKQLSDELTAKIKTNGYLWIEVETQSWQCYTFYVDFITLE